MIALGGPKLKLSVIQSGDPPAMVSMIALGGPKLKLVAASAPATVEHSFNDSTGWA